MEDKTKVGMNRTGMQMAPFEGAETVEYAQQRDPHPLEGGVEDIGLLRALYIKEALRIGSVPIPATVKGVAETVVGKVKGKNPEVLFDKLGQRAAFERSGVRLYQAMIDKVKATEHADKAALLADLTQIQQEELEHFHMLTQVIKDLGGDPTAQTPCADVSAVAALGLIQVLTDPRTTQAQGLEALLTAELADNACWELLIELAQAAGQDELVAPFQKALATEQEHEAMIKKWLQKLVMKDAT